jgi:hypothetical protein
MVIFHSYVSLPEVNIQHHGDLMGYKSWKKNICIGDGDCFVFYSSSQSSTFIGVLTIF